MNWKYITGALLLCTSLGLAQEINPWTIYDKLDPGIYRELAPNNAVSITTTYSTTLVRDVDSSIVWTGKYARCDFTNLTIAAVAHIYQELGGTNYTINQGWPTNLTLTIKTGVIPQPDMLKILASAIDAKHNNQ